MLGRESILFHLETETDRRDTIPCRTRREDYTLARVERKKEKRMEEIHMQEFIGISKREETIFYVGSHKFSMDLPNQNNTVFAELPVQVENLTGFKVTHFALVDDNSLEPLVSFGNLMVLRSNSLGNLVKNQFIIADTENTSTPSGKIQSSVIAVGTQSRRNGANVFNSCPPLNCKRQDLTHPCALKGFDLTINNLGGTLQPHTSRYTLELVIELYHEPY